MLLRKSLPYATLTAALAIAGSANAQLTNPSFETDRTGSTTITGWASSGNAFVSDTTNFSTPTAGVRQATLATATDGQFNEPAGVGTTAAVAETFLGLTSGSLVGVGNGNVANASAIRQTITLGVGDKLLFDFNFLTNETYNTGDAFSQRPDATRNDFAFFSLSRTGSSLVTKLMDTFQGYQDQNPTPSGFTSGFTLTPASDPFIAESGYRTYTYTATVAGSYTLGFGVADAYTTVTNGSVNSGLLVDNVRVQAVPEPATLAALGFGLAAFARRRRKA